MAWMQQMYSQYLNQYLLYMHSGAVNFVQPDLGVDSVQAGLQVQREQVGIRDVYPVTDFFPSRIRIFFNPGSTSKILSILTQKIVTYLSSYDPGFSSRIPDPDPDFLPIPDSRVKKASGSRIRNTAIFHSCNVTPFRIHLCNSNCKQLFFTSNAMSCVIRAAVVLRKQIGVQIF
jgi:hypothetical protein